MPYGMVEEVYRFNQAYFLSKGHNFRRYDRVQFTAEQNYTNDFAEWHITYMEPYVRPEIEGILQERKFRSETCKVIEITETEVKVEGADVFEEVEKSLMPSAFEIMIGKERNTGILLVIKKQNRHALFMSISISR